MPGNPFLVVGLGNPGSQYANTPHNLGFEVIDELAARWRISGFSKKFHSEMAEFLEPAGRKILLMKPQTYMNRSGLAVAEAVSFFKLVPAQDLLVLTDEMDLPRGTLRLRLSGGSAGHNGMNSVIESLGTEDFPRLRLGVGRSPNQPGEAYLLSKIPKASRDEYDKIRMLAAESVELCLKEGVAKAMNTVNRKQEMDEDKA